MPTFFFIPKPPPLPNTLGKKRPPKLKLIPQNSSTPFISSSETFSSISPTQICTTPEVKDFLATLSLNNIESLISYNANPIKNGQNGIVKRVTLFAQGKSRDLVKKQGGSCVAHESKMTEAIQNVTATNFPFELFALPVAQGSDGILDILYTCYQEIGDLQNYIEYIYYQYNINPSSVLSYLFQGFQQLLEAINILDSSKFVDAKGKIHQGIIHNDIKPGNIFLKTNGNFILGDFGCAYFKDESAPQISTFQFSAPELFTDENFCIKNLDTINSDVWSLGASFWYLLTHELLTPFPTKPLCDLEKFDYYKTWAENYSKKWKDLIKNHLNLTSEELGQQIKNGLDMDLKELQTNLNDPKNTEIKKKTLKKLALLMLAPVSERPEAFELKALMDKVEDYFVVDGDAKLFAEQLLARKKSENQAYQDDKNNNKPNFSR